MDRRPYIILGACNPNLAKVAIEKVPDIGLLMPCNVVVREEEDESVTVAFMDPVVVLGIAEAEELAEIGIEARERLLRVCEALSG